jgi:hypothetical protein
MKVDVIPRVDPTAKNITYLWSDNSFSAKTLTTNSKLNISYNPDNLLYANSSQKQVLFTMTPSNQIVEIKVQPTSIPFSSAFTSLQTPIYNVYIMNGKSYRGSVVQIPPGTSSIAMQTFFLPENLQVYNCSTNVNTGYILQLWTFAP